MSPAGESQRAFLALQLLLATRRCSKLCASWIYAPRAVRTSELKDPRLRTKLLSYARICDSRLTGERVESK
jgi:hypothetical protein